MQNCGFLPAFRGYDADRREVSGDGGSGIDLFGTGEGYRPGRNTYTINGLPATESQFMMEIESGHIGGTFGLIEMAARMSMGTYLGSRYTYADHAGRTWDGLDRDAAFGLQRETRGMITRHDFYFVNPMDNTWSVIGMLIPQGQTAQSGNTPLKPRDQKNLEKGLERLKNLKISEKCQKNVIDKLEKYLGFSFKDFQSFLAKGTEFYDGTKSTATVAGNVTLQLPADVKYGRGATVASVFNSDDANKQVNALTSITSPTLKAYFRPSSISGNSRSAAALLFHEALHGFGGTKGGTSYFDQDIQQALFGKNSEKVGEASSNISDYIKKHCF